MIDPQIGNNLVNEPVAKEKGLAKFKVSGLIKGMLIVLVGHAIATVIGFLLSLPAILSFFNQTHGVEKLFSLGTAHEMFLASVVFLEALAVLQLIYVIPALVVTLFKRKSDLAIGVLVAMSGTFLLAGVGFALCTASLVVGGVR